MTPTLEKQAANYDFTLAPDAGGYFRYHQNHRVYVEIISIDKLVSDATKRNQFLFDQLRLDDVPPLAEECGPEKDER